MELLNQFPNEKGTYFLLGLLENPEVTEQYFISCLRLIHENFKDDHTESLSEKKLNLYSTMFFHLFKSNKLNAFWYKASYYNDGINEDGSFKPVTSSLLEFFDASIIVGLKKKQKQLIKIILDKGFEFACVRMPKPERPNPLLEKGLTKEEKDLLISIANETSPIYKFVTFSEK